MTLRDLMDGDMDDVFLNTGELADSVTVTVPDSVTTFTASVALADPQQAAVIDADYFSQLDNTIEVTAGRTAWRAAMTTAGLTARDARRGDKLTFTGIHAGDWYVQDATVDIGGGMRMSLVREQTFGLHGANAVEVQ